MINQATRGFINYFKIANMKTHMREITSHLNRRIKAIIWKQWKTCKKRIESLMKLGICKNEAKKLAFSRKGFWKCSNNQIIDSAITSKRLKQKGLVFPLDYYLKVHI